MCVCMNGGVKYVRFMTDFSEFASVRLVAASAKYLNKQEFHIEQIAREKKKAVIVRRISVCFTSFCEKLLGYFLHAHGTFRSVNSEYNALAYVMCGMGFLFFVFFFMEGMWMIGLVRRTCIVQ